LTGIVSGRNINNLNKMKMRRIFSVVLIVFWSGMVMNAQNEKVKALFIYNFIKHVEWPQSNMQGDLIVGVLGSNVMKGELESLTSTQRMGNHGIKVKIFSNPEEVLNCHVLYVSPGKSGQIANLSAKLNSQSTLIISDGRNGIAQGAGINFTINDDKLRFEISKNRIEQHGMKVSSDLVKMGIEVM
jgi:hypothetical protein